MFLEQETHVFLLSDNNTASKVYTFCQDIRCVSELIVIVIIMSNKRNILNVFPRVYLRRQNVLFKSAKYG